MYYNIIDLAILFIYGTRFRQGLKMSEIILHTRR